MRLRFESDEIWCGRDVRGGGVFEGERREGGRGWIFSYM